MFAKPYSKLTVLKSADKRIKKGFSVKNFLDEKSKLLHHQIRINKVYILAGECFCKFFGNTCTEQIKHYFSVFKKTNQSILDLFKA